MDPVDFLYKLASAAKDMSDKALQKSAQHVKQSAFEQKPSGGSIPMNLMNCSQAAMAQCPDAEACGDLSAPGQFMEGSECHKFNEAVERSLWTPAKVNPPKNGEYLIARSVKLASGPEFVIDIAYFAQRLCDVDEYEFTGRNHPGWCKFDSDYGYYRMPSVAYWMPLPTPPQKDQ